MRVVQLGVALVDFRGANGHGRIDKHRNVGQTLFAHELMQIKENCLHTSDGESGNENYTAAGLWISRQSPLVSAHDRFGKDCLPIAPYMQPIAVRALANQVIRMLDADGILENRCGGASEIACEYDP